MQGLIQRVSRSSVAIDDEIVGAIEHGILLLLGIEQGDDQAKADKLLHRVINYRIFADAEGKMNRSLLDVNGGLLVVSQFTLAADTRKGMRPSFSSAADPDSSRKLYNYFLQQAAQSGILLQSGRFSADMKVSLVNDGPVTFLLNV